MTTTHDVIGECGDPPRTCSNLFTWDPLLLPHGDHRTSIGKPAVGFQLKILLVEDIITVRNVVAAK